MANARAVALRALVELERGPGQRLRAVLATDRLEPRDAAFAFELAHGVVRRQRCLDHVLAGVVHRGLPDEAPLLAALRLGVYQLLFVPGMPSHAAVHATVAVVRGNKGFANAVLRRVAAAVQDHAAVDPRTELDLGPQRSFTLALPLPDDAGSRLAVLHSLPDFLVQRWLADHGLDAVHTIAAAASATPAVFLRVSAGTTLGALRDELTAASVQVEPCTHPRLLRWAGGASPFATAAFRAGRFVVQDPTALMAAEAVPCGPGSVVVDLCAAPGTKTTALAERVRPGGRVVAFDVDPERRARIADNVARLALGDVVTIVDDVAALPPADAVLADVPCSNTGVLARRVEVRRRLQPDTFTQLATLQRELLRQAIGLCRPGGAVVYSTCSIERDENDAVVQAVLLDPATPRCELGPSLRTVPRPGEHDGGYFAVLRRRG